MGNQPIEERAEDTQAFDGFAADAHGQPEKSETWNKTWADRLGVAARDSDFAPLPSTRELLAQAAQMPLPPLPQRESIEASADRAARFISDQEPLDEIRSPEEGLHGSVWRLDQATAVNFARAQGAFIKAQNAFLKDKDTAKIAAAQHLFIEAQAAVLEKFGVV